MVKHPSQDLYKLSTKLGGPRDIHQPSTSEMNLYLPYANICKYGNPNALICDVHVLFMLETFWKMKILNISRIFQ